MAYEPTTWEDGDTITSVRLNKIEQGIANNDVLIVDVVYVEDEEEQTVL